MKLNKNCSKLFAATIALSLTLSSTVFAAGVGVISGDNVNVRTDKTTTAEVLERLDSGTEISVNSFSDDWFEISYDDVDSAYISSQFVDVVSNRTRVNSDVTIKSLADNAGEDLGELLEGDRVIIVAKCNDWYKITFSDNEGFIPKSVVNDDGISEFVEEIEAPKPPAQYAVVQADSGLKLRGDSTTESEVLTVLPFNSVVDIVEPCEYWAKIETPNGEVGFISTEFISIHEGEKPEPVVAAASALGSEVVAYGKKFIGTTYSYGGTNLTKGVDCSGFVYATFKDFGINLTRTSSGMWKSEGTYVNKSDLQVGDLVFFDTSGANDGQVSHVGIYAGNGTYIHSSSGKIYGVTVTDLYNDYSVRTYVGAKRVL